ncbi:MAG: chaperonin Cpn10 [Myxococcales bacterium]|mgnify:CR=1 FL=1|nr:chaperonin Cpn10 [Myxococcales bacterium]
MPKDTEATHSVRHIKPLGPRILAKLIKLDERSAAGLFLPEGVKEQHDDAAYGEVIEVARAESSDEPSLGKNVSGVPMGARILFPKHKGLTVPWDDSLRLLEVKDVVAVVEEVKLSDLQ